MAELYRLLFADDEYWIRENFRNCLDWNSLDIDFLEPAVDGEDALRKVFGSTPDILITDINMPFLNGTELIAEIRKKNADIRIIVLSGYDDFQYVHDALVAGASEYLLKPLDPEKIRLLVSKLIFSIQQQKKEQDERLQFREKVADAEALLTDRRMSNLLLPEEQQPLTGDRIPAPENAIPPLSPFCLILVKTGVTAMPVRLILETCFGDRALAVFNNIYAQNESVVLFDAGCTSRDSICNKVISELGALCTAHIGISRRFDSVLGIPKAYAEALSAIRSKPGAAGSFRISIEDVGAMPRAASIPALIANELSLAVQTHDRKRIEDVILNRIGFTPENIGKWSWYELKETVGQIVRIVVQSCPLPEDLSADRIAMENLIDMVEIAIDFCDPARVVEIVGELVDGFLDLQGHAQGGDSMKNVVRFAAKYIDEHYFEPLSLASIAVFFHVEPSYLSRMFKQETGGNIVVHIAKTRIEKATEYIRTTDMSFANISSLVGYDDYAYFNRVFRKVSGMSPSEYREFVRSPRLAD